MSVLTRLSALALLAAIGNGCGGSPTVADRPTSSVAVSQTDDERAPSDATDEELTAALADLITVEAYGPGTDDCVARGIVETIGGDELRALGWTPETMKAPGFSLYIELEQEQYHILDTALVACVDAVALAADLIGVGAGEVDQVCLEAALGPNPSQAVVRSFPTDPNYDRGLAVAGAALDCMDPVEFVVATWLPVAPWYTTAGGIREADLGVADHACIASWLGDDERANSLVVFELVQLYRWIDDNEALVDQVDHLNGLMASGGLATDQLDELHSCFTQ